MKLVGKQDFLEFDPVDVARRIATGDLDAERELVAQYSRGILAMLRVRTKDFQRADDIHQDVFCIAIEHLRESKVKHPEKLSSYLHRTAINLIIGEDRKRQRRRTDINSEVVDHFPDRAPDQLNSLIRKESDEAVRQILSELTKKRDRKILNYFYILQREKSEICVLLNLSSAHFDRVISRARKRFRELIEVNRLPLK